MLRPAATRWFELLVAREQITTAVGALAATGRVELESRPDARLPLSLPQLDVPLDAYRRLARRYHVHWPQTGLRAAPRGATPRQVLESGLARLQAWELRAAPVVKALETGIAEQEDLGSLHRMLAGLHEPVPDLALLAGSGPVLSTCVLAFPPGAVPANVPDALLHYWVEAREQRFLLALGPSPEIAALCASVAGNGPRAISIPPRLHGDRAALLQQIEQRLHAGEVRIKTLRDTLEALAREHDLARVLGEIRLLEWFTEHVRAVPATEHFARVSGWTDDFGGRQLRAALERAKVPGLLRMTEPPADASPPLVLRNPAWARPFELFTRLLGTPGADEADPSPLLALLVPLLFGYMFGDVGQGLVLTLVGLLLRGRWPVFGVLVINGVAAAAFGLVFGSVFGRDDIVAPLWIHPTAQPVDVLVVPLAGGVLILLLGLLLNALESFWRGQLARWWMSEAPVLVLYLSLLGAPFSPPAALLSVLALLWYAVGGLIGGPGKTGPGLLAALGKLVESLLQLFLNTLSFVRVGAFALAHAGLSLAFNTLAGASDHALVAGLVLLLGNLLVIMLEGLVVTVQATRLILFEFLIRFLRGSGRVFRPLPAPRFKP